MGQSWQRFTGDAAKQNMRQNKTDALAIGHSKREESVLRCRLFRLVSGNQSKRNEEHPPPREPPPTQPPASGEV